MKNFNVYLDTKTKEIRTLDSIREQYYIDNDSDISISYKDFEHIIITSMIVSNGGKYKVLTINNSPEFKLSLEINNVLNEVNSNGTGKYFGELEHQENTVNLMNVIIHKDKQMCEEYEICLKEQKEHRLAERLHTLVFEENIKKSRSKNR